MKKEDSDTRYFIDLDLETRVILQWDYDQRDKLVKHKLAEPTHHRIYLTKGQYNKLVQKDQEIEQRI